MITTIAVSVAITAIILLILFIGLMNVSQSIVLQDNKTMLLRMTTLIDNYNTDQERITKILTELTIQLHNFSVAVDEVVSSIYDSAMKFPPDMDHRERPIEFSPEEFVDKLNKNKLRLDRSDMEDLKKIFLDIEKFKDEDNDFNNEEKD